MKRNRLKVLRAECRITQLDLALKVGLSRDQYWHIENGYTAPRAVDRRRLAKALRVTEAELGFDVPAEATQ